jgi:PST family polysaccharide transporter
MARSFQNALKWAYIGSWGDKGFSALFVIILAAILGPRDFGTVSIAAAYIGFLQLFLDQGLGAALIQRKNLEQEHLDAVFWMDILLSLVLIAFSLLLGRQWARVNHAPGAGVVIAALSPCILIEALAMVQMAHLRRDMDFRSLALRGNASVIASGLIGLGLAFAGFRVWALVAQQLAKDAISLALLWRLSPWRPRLEFSWKHLRDLIGFSIPNFIGQLGTYADAQGSSVALGVLFGPVAVGLYRLGERITNSVITMAMASIQSVSFSEFSRLQDDREAVRRSVLHCIRLSGAVTVPALAGLAAVSRPLMATLGAKWAPASGVLTILCVAGMVMVFTFFTGPLLQALGRPRDAAILEWIRVGAGVAALVLTGVLVRNSAVSRQLLGIALSRLGAALLVAGPLFVAILLKVCRIPFRTFLASVWPSAAASFCAVCAVRLLGSFAFLNAVKPVLQLAAEVALGAAAGLGALLLLDRELQASLKGMWQRTWKLSEGVASL